MYIYVYICVHMRVHLCISWSLVSVHICYISRNILHMSIYVYICTCICTRKCTCICTQMYTYMDMCNIRVHLRTYTCTFVHFVISGVYVHTRNILRDILHKQNNVHICVHIHVHLRTCTRTFAYMYVYICALCDIVYMYIHVIFHVIYCIRIYTCSFVYFMICCISTYMKYITWHIAYTHTHTYMHDITQPEYVSVHTHAHRCHQSNAPSWPFYS